MHRTLLSDLSPIFVKGIVVLDLSRGQTSPQLESMFQFSDSWDVASVLNAAEIWAQQSV